MVDAKIRVFLASHFGQLGATLPYAMSQASAELGFELIRPDQDVQLGDELASVTDMISTASLVVADVSESNSNVMWELGFAHAMGKPVLVLTADPGAVPFDLRNARVLTYSLAATMGNLRSRLQDAISELLTGGREGRQGSPPTRHRVFFSYSHTDAEYLDRIFGGFTSR